MAQRVTVVNRTGKHASSMVVLWSAAITLLLWPAGANYAQERQKSPAPATSELEGLFEAVLAASRDDKPELLEKASAFVDSARLLREIERQRLLGGLTPADRTSLLVAIETTLTRGLIQEGRSAQWRAFRIERLESQGQETAAVVRMLREDGTSATTMRFWVAKDGKKWRAYDWADADALFRTSTNVGAALALMRGDYRSRSIQALIGAARLAADGQFAEAERSLAMLDDDLPPVLEAARWLVHAQTQLGQGQSADALRSLDIAAVLFENSATLLRLRATAHQKLGNHDTAVALARDALEHLGHDAKTHALLGDALAGQGNVAEAAKAYRSGLAEDAHSLENLIGLAAVLPKNKKVEVADRFLKLDEPVLHFETIANALVARKEVDALQVLVAAYSKIAPESPIADVYRAEALVIREQVEPAAKLFAAAISRLEQPTMRSYVGDRLLSALLAAKRPLDAYAQASSPDYAFGFLADRLLEEQDAQALSDLVTIHRQKRPEDIRLAFYAGQVLLLEQKPQQAEQEFGDGMARAPNEEVREIFRKLRVQARFDVGQGLSAYRDIGPRKATFDQLARLFAENDKTDQLLALVSAHRMVDPDDPNLNRWEGEAKLLGKNYEAAAELLTAAIPRTATSDLGSQELPEKALKAWLLAGKPMEGYRTAPEPTYAFGFLARRFLTERDAERMAELIEEHRQKRPDDIQLDYFGGLAAMMAEDYEAAEKTFAAGMAKARNERVRDQLQNERLRAFSEMGKALEAYEKLEPKRATFDQLARLSAAKSDSVTLEQLVVAHRKTDPDDSNAELWEAEVEWIRQDYAAVVEALTKNRESILADPSNMDRFSDRLIRSLVRLKQFDKAIEHAKASTATDGDPWFEAVVRAAAGDPAGTAHALDRCTRRGYSPTDFYADPDLAPALQSEKLKSLRLKYPPPQDADAAAVQTPNK